MRVFFIFTMLISMLACQSGQPSKPAGVNPPESHKIVVKEVLQAGNYTYLLGLENGKEQWLAVPAMQAKVGETYYYDGGFEMTKFESKELKRTFASVMFLEGVRTEAAKTAKSSNPHAGMNMDQNQSQPATGAKAKVEKEDVKVAKVTGGITIAELFANKKSYLGKTVKIKGKVTKFTPEVMGKNWIHIQDGTEYQGKFDLTLTTKVAAKVGDTVTLEGKISLDKDLGFGYFFDVLMEDAVAK